MSFFEILAIYVSFVLIVIVFGVLKYDDKIKKKIIIMLSCIYNIFIGYIDTVFVLLIYMFMTNHPKGNGYEVPKSDAGINMIIGIIILIIYLLLVIPLNVFMKKKTKINIRIYFFINLVATIIGISIYWIFLDKTKKLF